MTKEKEEKIKEEINNKYNVYEILGIVILAVVYVIIMYAYTSDGIKLPSNKVTSNEIVRTDLKYEEIMFECPQVILFNDEIAVIEEIKKIYDINENNQDNIHFNNDEIQNLYDKLEGSTLTITNVLLAENSENSKNRALSISGIYEDFDLSYGLLYVSEDNFSKVIFTTEDPTLPYYLNENNQTYTRAVFP